MKRYFTVAWYQDQIVLNPGNYIDGSAGLFKKDIRPMDWPYCYGFFAEMTVNHSHTPVMGMWMQNLIKAFHNQDVNNGALSQGAGWSPQRNADLSWILGPQISSSWAYSDITATQRREFIEGMCRYWIFKCKQFTPAKYYACNFGDSASWTAPADPEAGLMNAAGVPNLPNILWRELPWMTREGVSAATRNEIKAWAYTIWPNANWNGL
jgi:hypothetical protein